MNTRALTFELGAALGLSAAAWVTVSFISNRDAASELLASLFVCPLAAVLGIWLVNFFVLRQRGWRFLPNILLAAVLSVVFTAGTVWVLDSILAAWMVSALVACLVWHAANH